MLTVLLALVVVYALVVLFAVALGKASAASERMRVNWPEYFEAVAEYELEVTVSAPTRSSRFARRGREVTAERVADIPKAAAA